ncbi:MAG: hypothetical protein HWD82_10155 [Flavobacteriaceae bacterium]|nr:hypothetical protein [Flavobacteriaceae bacterium]
MYKSTIQQIIVFAITAVIFIQTGKYLIALNDIRTFIDFGAIMLFFITLIIFLNVFSRLASKLFRVFSF